MRGRKFSGESAPIFFSRHRKENGRGRSKEKMLRRKGGPNGPPFRVTGVVRIGAAGIDGPVDPAPDRSREESGPRITTLGGGTGRKPESVYFCSRAFRCATRYLCSAETASRCALAGRLLGALRRGGFNIRPRRLP